MNEPKDIFKNIINEGDIICYAARNGTRQELNFAIVLRIDNGSTHERSLTLRGLDYIFFRSGYYRLKGETQATPKQLWVIKDTSVFPEQMIKTLQSGFDLHVRREQKKVENALAKENGRQLTPGQRYQQNLRSVVEDQKIQDLLRV